MSSNSRHALGQSVGFSAFVWGYPLVETVRTCRLQTVHGTTSKADWKMALDTLYHKRKVATHKDRDVVTPANDLLYTSGWLNLRNGPRLLTVPAREEFPGVYFVLALYDAWTNNFANPGFRESPAQGETIMLVGPDHAEDAVVPEGVRDGIRVVHSPTNLVWVISRVLAGEGEALEAARTLQSGITLTCPAGMTGTAVPKGVTHWMGPPEDTIAALLERPEAADAIAAQFFTNLCRSLADVQVPAADAGLAQWVARGGLVASDQFDFAQLSQDLRSGLVEGLVSAARWVEEASRSRTAKPWALNFNIGRYGSDYLARSVTAYKGLGALAAEEALYGMCDFDSERRPLDGRQRYAMRFAPGERPPVDGFWSVTMYDADRFLYDNPMGRHAIGDRTPQLLPDADGSLTLIISHAQPGNTSNWLPAPAGPCYLVIRLYMPREEVRGWIIPTLQRVTA